MGHAATSAGKKHEGLWPDGDATTRLRGSIGGRGRSQCYGDDQTRYLHPCTEIGLEEVAKMRKARVYCVLSRCRLFAQMETHQRSHPFSTAADKHVPVNIERFFGFLSKHVSDMQKYPFILRNILPPASVLFVFHPDAIALSSLHAVDLLASDVGGGARRGSRKMARVGKMKNEREGVKMEQVGMKRKEGAPCDQTEVPSSPA